MTNVDSGSQFKQSEVDQFGGEPAPAAIDDMDYYRFLMSQEKKEKKKKGKGLGVIKGAINRWREKSQLKKDAIAQLEAKKEMDELVTSIAEPVLTIMDTISRRAQRIALDSDQGEVIGKLNLLFYSAGDFSLDSPANTALQEKNLTLPLYPTTKALTTPLLQESKMFSTLVTDFRSSKERAKFSAMATKLGMSEDDFGVFMKKQVSEKLIEKYIEIKQVLISKFGSRISPNEATL